MESLSLHSVTAEEISVEEEETGRLSIKIRSTEKTENDVYEKSENKEVKETENGILSNVRQGYV